LSHRAVPDGTCVALVLQGGGALGSYQAGVFEGLTEAAIEPHWVAGISIGAINAALIAGNAPERRVDRLREFWREICRQPGWLADAWPLLPPADAMPAPLQAWRAGVASWRALLEGQHGFFHPRWAPPLVSGSGSAQTASWYDTGALRDTLERLVDFDRLNDPRGMRVAIGAVQVRSGNMRYFDNRRCRLGSQHVMASAALPPGFPAVLIDGEPYWDGGLVSNTPLLHVLHACDARRDMLVFQVDLWSARGPSPTSLPEAAERLKDIQYSSRTRLVTDLMRRELQHRRELTELLALVPPERRSAPAARHAASAGSPRRCNVIHLIHQSKHREGQNKDYEFSAATMRAHWLNGLDDLRRTLRLPQCLALPPPDHPFVTHDVQHHGARQADVPAATKAHVARHVATNHAIP
jgi:NTE family protein